MNTIWSSLIQGTETLYYSRKLRFDDLFCAQFLPLFSLPTDKPLKILEIGCGPGALAGALHRWYPSAEITGIDRDSTFIEFARAHEGGIDFCEGDATALPFGDGSFDVTISNTVSEHIEPSAFFGEQLRVLKPGGICLVLSSRKGINIAAPCLASTPKEQAFWQKAEQYDDSFERYAICKYPLSEAELPKAMEQYGFSAVSVGYAAVDLTPDNPRFSPELAHAIIHSQRQTALNPLDTVSNMAPGVFPAEELEKMRQLIDEKFDRRAALYDRGEKQWDTNLNIIMVVRGVKHA